METMHVDQLTGTWVNQLDSRLYIEMDPSGSLHGSYVSAVGDLAGKSYPLLGFCDLGGRDGVGTLGFVVHWTKDHSVTTWAGHYDPVTQEITASWLLAYPAGIDLSRSWRSTLVGHDIFHRREVL
jgi:Avidin family